MWQETSLRITKASLKSSTFTNPGLVRWRVGNDRWYWMPRNRAYELSQKDEAIYTGRYDTTVQNFAPLSQYRVI
ncbi:hypothetical protein SLEP1_g18956 [Rubroshorea leprosula]|uniref:Uncharacterized protein n=1 Tax=Rubroshorea leprosula TaxID=152421 RepID=A0AAV5J856_9ROSI|nr:hypothetical protein SLEP1_g18956 [Rubroshorea leprosula]